MVTALSVVYAFRQLFVGKWFSFAEHMHLIKKRAKTIGLCVFEVLRRSIWFIVLIVLKSLNNLFLAFFHKFRIRSGIAWFLFTYLYLHAPNVRKKPYPNHSLPWIYQSIHHWNYIVTRFEPHQSSCYLSSTTEHENCIKTAQQRANPATQENAMHLGVAITPSERFGFRGLLTWLEWNLLNRASFSMTRSHGKWKTNSPTSLGRGR